MKKDIKRLFVNKTISFLFETFLVMASFFSLTSCSKNQLFIPENFSPVFSQMKLHSLASLARKTAEKVTALTKKQNATSENTNAFNINNPREIFPYPDSKKLFLSDDDLGISVRFIKNNKDRGCLAIYSGLDKKHLKDAVKYCTSYAVCDPRYEKITYDEISELKINICIFSKWQKMDSPYDFTLGEDSLIVENPETCNEETARTLLQSAFGTERNFSKDEFLKRLCKKANISEDAYIKKRLVFYKSRTLTYYLD